MFIMLSGDEVIDNNLIEYIAIEKVCVVFVCLDCNNIILEVVI